VAAGSPAAAAHLKSNDTILAVDGHRVRWLSDVQNVVAGDVDQHPGEVVTLTIRRNSRDMDVGVVPRISPPPHQGPIGIELNRTVNVAYGPSDSLGRSIRELGAMVSAVPLVIRSLSQPTNGELSGPIGIARTTTDAVSNEPATGPGYVIQLVALLSASLGVLNLLPFPALDGGRIVFVLISWIRRRNLDPELEGVIHMAGMMALMVLIMVISYNDVARWVSGQS
jgi:regulator of sigma E protease